MVRLGEGGRRGRGMGKCSPPPPKSCERLCWVTSLSSRKMQQKNQLVIIHWRVYLQSSRQQWVRIANFAYYIFRTRSANILETDTKTHRNTNCMKSRTFSWFGHTQLLFVLLKMALCAPLTRYCWFPQLPCPPQLSKKYEKLRGVMGVGEGRE